MKSYADGRVIVDLWANRPAAGINLSTCGGVTHLLVGEESYKTTRPLALSEGGDLFSNHTSDQRAQGQSAVSGVAKVWR